MTKRPIPSSATRSGSDRFWRRHVQLSALLESILLSALLLASISLSASAHAQGNDSTRPVIVHDPVREVSAGGSVSVEARVTDDTGVEAVRLHLGLGGYQPQAMIFQGNDVWSASIDASNRKEGEVVKYFISAVDAAGNEQSRGFDFDPFLVDVGAPVVTTNSGASWRSSENKIYYYAAGAAGVILVALLATSGGSDDNDPFSLENTVTFR